MSLNESDFASDTDDEDYVPTGDGHDASEEENSGDEEHESGASADLKKKSKNKSKSNKAFNVRQSMFDDGEKVDWNKELENEKKEQNEEKEKKKADDLWADFKKDTSSTTTVSQRCKAGSSLSSLFSNDLKGDSSNKTVSKPSNRLSSLFDNNEDNGVKTDISKAVKQKPRSLLSGLFDDSDTGSPSEQKVESISTETSKVTPSDHEKIEITKEYDFAGEVVKVSKQVDADSSEAKKFMKSQETTSNIPSVSTKRPSGLAGIIGSIGKKPKMGCLDKSKMDWNSFVEESGIREELSTFNKGKDGYVEKQMFLERADLRQFEHEKSIRDKNRKSLMK